jgi:hypothetical protein
MAHNIEKISDDKDVQLLYATVMQELEDTIQRFNRSLVLCGIVYRHSEREGNNEGKETIKKKVLEDLDTIVAVCKEAESEIEIS